MAHPASLKQRIRNGEIVNGVGASMESGKEDLARILQQGKVDFFNVDCQHGPQSEDRIVSFCSAAEALGVPVILRIKHTRHTYLIGNYLDLGPAGILVPEVREEATVREAVHFFYYPQFGGRSWGGSARYGIGDRSDRLAYAAWWNDTGVLWLQLESVDAVINCRKLAQDGVDVLTFGPNDLMFDIERYHRPPFRTVDDCVRHVAREMEGTPVAVSLALLDPSDRDKYVDMGLTVLQTPMVV